MLQSKEYSDKVIKVFENYKNTKDFNEFNDNLNNIIEYTNNKQKLQSDSQIISKLFKNNVSDSEKVIFINKSLIQY